MSNVPIPRQIRDTQTDPPYLQGPNGQRFMYTLRLMKDLLLEKLNQGMRAHMPGQQTNDSTLPFVGDDRLIVQGPGESPAAYGARLAKANASWGRAGSRRAVLEQIQGFLQGTDVTAAVQLPEALIVGSTAATPVGGFGTTATWDVAYNRTAIGDPPAHSAASPANWNWDGTYRRWWQWLILFFHLVPTGQSGTTATFHALARDTGLGQNVAGVWVPAGVTVADGPFVTVTGLSGLLTSNAGQFVTWTNCNSGVNLQTVQIVSVLTDSSCVVAMPNHVIADANNGAIHWSISYYPIVAPGLAWGAPSALWGDTNRSIGLSVTSEYVVSIRAILRLWKKAETYYPNIIFAFDGGSGVPGDMFSPLSSQGSGNPDGTWGSPGKTVAGVWVPSRACNNNFDAFADGTGQYVDCAVPNVT